ncbi:Ig-like domain-containing protein, partial [Arachnia propionica]
MKKPTVHTVGRRALYALLAAVIGVSANLQASPAHAAQVEAINADSITISNETRPGQNINVNDTVRVEAAWSIPNQTGRAGDTFTLGLPVNALEGKVGSFNLTPEGQDAPVYGTCQVTKTDIECTLSAEAENKDNVGGRLWFTSRAHQEYNEANLTFTVNGNTPKEVPLPNGAQGIGYDPFTPQELMKMGYFIDDDTLTWRVIVPGKALADKSQLSISDPYATPGTNFTLEGAWFYKIPNTPKCWNNLYSDECRTELWSKEGAATEGVNVAFDDAKDTINVTVGAPFQIQEDKIYTLHIDLKVDGTVVNGSEFENTATVNGQVVTQTATKEAAGGGTGSGDAAGHIRLVKRLDGANTVPADTIFPVEFSFERAGQPVTGTLSLKADGTPVLLRNISNGVVVTFKEGVPTVPGNTFGDPVFSGEGVNDGGGASTSATVTAQGTKTVEVTLTNPVQPAPEPPKVVLAAPALNPGTCTPGSLTPSNPTVEVAPTEGITYSQPQLTPRPGTNIVDVTLTATAEAGKAIDAAQLPAGWAMNPDGTATFTGQIEQPVCEATKVIPVDPTFQVGQCTPGEVEPTDPTITAATTEGITYSASWAVDGDEVVFTATATAKDGYVIDKDKLTAGWTWNDEKKIAQFEKREPKPVCAQLVVPVSPTVTPGV